jgi:vanillate O-demethylase ferredoxin subunit
MHYWSRTASRTAFLNRIRRSAFAANVAFHFDDGAQEQLLSLTDALAGASEPRDVYLCGPPGFLAAAKEAANHHGWPADRIHFEYFAPPPEEGRESEAFEVQLASTGAVFLIPADKTVAEVLTAHSVNIPLSCEQGVCGTCLTRVIAGTPEHRDLVLTAEERARNDQFTPCCSRSRSRRLVLDL